MQSYPDGGIRLMHLRRPPVLTDVDSTLAPISNNLLMSSKWRTAFPWGVVGLIAKARHPMPHYSSFPRPHRLHSASFTH